MSRHKGRRGRSQGRELLNLGDISVFSITEERGGVFGLAIDAEDRCLFRKTGALIRAGCMNEVMFDRHDLGLMQIKTELQKTPFDTLSVSLIAPVAG